METAIVLANLALAFLFVMFIVVPCVVAYRVDLDLPEPPEQ
jgi:hypothetical protein